MADLLPDHSRSEITQWIRDGRVLLNGAVKAAKFKVAGREVVEIDVPPPRVTELIAQDIPLEIIYEDDHLIIVNKASGLTVHPGTGQPDGTLANALIHHFQGLPELIGSDRPGIVHRLDRDTSGVIVVTKTEAAQRTISKAFADRRIEKTYLALVHGLVGNDTGKIDGPIGRSPTNRTRMTIRVDGRASLTRWVVQQRYAKHTLVACMPVTGRTHQIRVHLRSLHHPVVGDPFYGWRSASQDAEAGRLMLHAWKIGFAHPVTGEALIFEAPPPEDFRRARERIEALDA